MRRKRKTENIPEEWVYCPVCKRLYGFISCRVTTNDGEICLTCLVKKKEDEQKGTIQKVGGSL